MVHPVIYLAWLTYLADFLVHSDMPSCSCQHRVNVSTSSVNPTFALYTESTYIASYPKAIVYIMSGPLSHGNLFSLVAFREARVSWSLSNFPEACDWQTSSIWKWLALRASVASTAHVLSSPHNEGTRCSCWRSLCLSDFSSTTNRPWESVRFLRIKIHPWTVARSERLSQLLYVFFSPISDSRKIISLYLGFHFWSRSSLPVLFLKFSK